MARCARTSAKSGEMDRRGICGAACTCGIPACNSFVTMTTAEQFLYYPRVVGRLVQERDVQVFGMDNACHLKKYLEKRCVPSGCLMCV